MVWYISYSEGIIWTASKRKSRKDATSKSGLFACKLRISGVHPEPCAEFVGDPLFEEQITGDTQQTTILSMVNKRYHLACGL
jgi:hypothetical protein